jgi:hypothetical protein
MRRRGPALAAVAAALGCAPALAGCGAAPPSAAEPAAPAPAPAVFAGRLAGGLGASVDFAGFDPVARAVRRAFGAAGRPAHVGIASLVNDAGAPAPVPRFTAIDRAGRRRELATAAAALRGLAGPEARRARAALREPAAVPAEGGAVLYLVLRGAAPGELRELRMRGPAGRAAELRRRD